MFIVKDCTRNPPYTMVSNDAKNVRDVVMPPQVGQSLRRHTLKYQPESH